MKRSGILITVLLSLFMFQSVWNVAAAFCGHESTIASNQFISTHFGHHVALHCTQDQQQHTFASVEQNHSLAQTHDVNQTDFLNHLSDDHSDHLPSFAHFIVADVQQQSEQPKFRVNPESKFMDWHNLYRSPHLILPNPPPALSPL